MSSIVKKILYTVLLVAFLANYIAGNALFDPVLLNYVVSIFGFDVTLTQEMFDAAMVISSTLNYAALLVIINVINVANKNTEVTQGTLDNKQNVTLKNQAWIMEGLLFMVKSNNIGSVEKKDELISAYETRIPFTKDLSNTFIDFKTVDTETKIINMNNTIAGLEISIAEAKDIQDAFTVKLLTTALVKATSTLADLTKKLND